MISTSYNSHLMWALVLLISASSVPAAAAVHTRPLRFIAAPIVETSTAMDIMGVTAQLQARGHKVLVVAADSVMPFMQQAAARHSSNTTAAAMDYIPLNITAAMSKATAATGKKQRAVKTGRVTHTRFAVQHLPSSLTAGMELEVIIQDVVAEPCAAVIADADVMKQLREFQADAVMSIGIPIPDTASDSCGCLLSHALGIPMIDIDCGMTFWSGPPTVPQFGLGLSQADLATWSGYSLNLLSWVIKQAVRPSLEARRDNPWTAVRDRLGLPRAASQCPVINAVWKMQGHEIKKCDVLLDVVLGSWLVEAPRPLASHQVLVGPGTPRLPHAITPPEVADFVDGATDGVVLVAFGTSFQFNKWLKPVDFIELSAGFASLAPTRVLWNINTKALPVGVKVEDWPLGPNVKLVPWVDYNDVLGHSHTKAFVTHCGIHSIYEAAFHGVPILGVPFMFEQAESGAKLAAAGAGVVSQQAPAFRTGAAASVRYTRENVAGMIVQVIERHAYAEAARRMSLALKTQARRRQPYEAAADEVELAVYIRLVQQLLHHDHEAVVAKSETGKDAQCDSSTARKPGQKENENSHVDEL